MCHTTFFPANRPARAPWIWVASFWWTRSTLSSLITLASSVTESPIRSSQAIWGIGLGVARIRLRPGICRQGMEASSRSSLKPPLPAGMATIVVTPRAFSAWAILRILSWGPPTRSSAMTLSTLRSPLELANHPAPVANSDRSWVPSGAAVAVISLRLANSYLMSWAPSPRKMTYPGFQNMSVMEN